ncbi:MAG: HpcH/HpaI aldolase family protein [Parahaliea sp.]
MKNKALAQWRNGEKSLGVWVGLSDVTMTEVISRLGADWICFDMQHGLMDYTHLIPLLPAIAGQDVTPIARVAANREDLIGKALDAGIQGVIVPMVNTAEEAAAAVSACYYPPVGLRSCGPMRPILLNGPEYMAQSNDETACIVMIETEEGLRNADAIAAVEGLDAIFVGPVDLCYGLGITPGDFTNPLFTEALSKVLAVCRKNNLAAGIFGYSPELARQALDQGFDFASAGTDLSFYRDGLTRGMTIARGENPDQNKAQGGY